MDVWIVVDNYRGKTQDARIAQTVEEAREKASALMKEHMAHWEKMDDMMKAHPKFTENRHAPPNKPEWMGNVLVCPDGDYNIKVIEANHCPKKGGKS